MKSVAAASAKAILSDIPKIYLEGGAISAPSPIKRASKPQLNLKPLIDEKYEIGTLVFDRPDGRCSCYKSSDAESFEPPRAKASELTFLSQNIWFQTHNQRERYQTLVAMLRQSKADFICLQEVIGPFLEQLLKDTYFTQNYFWSGNKITSYGVVILSRWPCVFYELGFPSKMGRSLLIAQTQINGQSLLVGTAHFQSLNNARLSKQQMEIAFAALKASENALLMGDFNFDPSWKAEQAVISPDYSDLFLHFDGKQSQGFTMPKTIHFPAWRPDRLLARCKHFEPLLFDIIGRFPCPSYEGEDIMTIKKDGMVRTPSDHYGLLGTIKAI